MIPQVVKLPDVRRFRDVVFRQPADHLAPGHFAHGPLFHDFAPLPLAEGAADQADIFRQVGLHRPAVLLGGQVQHEVRLLRQPPGQLIAPKGVQVLTAVHRQLCLHLQPVGRHAVKGPQQAVTAGDDTQILLDEVILLRFKHAGGHVLVLDALIGQHSRGQTAAQVHSRQPLHVQGRDGIVALPEGLQFFGRHGPQDGQQPLRFRQKVRQGLDGQAVGVHPHFLGGRNDDSHIVTLPHGGSGTFPPGNVRPPPPCGRG